MFIGTGLGIGESGGVPAVPLTLTQIQDSAVWAFSLRKVVSTYSGNCINIRRSSDNATQDIGFDGTGWVDTAAIATFCGANTGSIATWYDQSASGVNVTQATGTAQPVIYASGVQITIPNGKPGVRYIAGNSVGLSHGTGIPFTADCSCFFVGEKLAGNTAQASIIGGASGCMGLRFQTTTGYLQMLKSGITNLETTASAPSAGMHAISSVFNSSFAMVDVDGVETIGSTAPNLSANVRSVGQRLALDSFANQGTNPRYSELLYWNTGISAASRATLRADAITVYGTP